MTEFDKTLTGALDADDEAFLRKLDEERGLFAQIGDTMAGPLGGWARLAAFNSVLLTVIMAVAVWQMFVAGTDRLLILWATAALASLIAQAMLKQWFFERMNFISLRRELKRLELRIVHKEDR